MELQRTAAPALVRDELLKQPWPPIETSLLFDYRYDLPHQFPFLPGLVQVILAAAGAVAYAVACLRAPGRRPRLWLLALVPVARFLVFLHGRRSAWIRDHVPLMSYLQFPYRLLGLFGLITSLFAGFLVLAVPHGIPRGVAAAAVACIALVVGLANPHPSMRGGVPAEFDARSLLMTEAATANLSGAIDSEYLPRWVTASTADVMASASPGAGAQGPSGGAGGPAPAGTIVAVERVADSEFDLHVLAPGPTTIVLRQSFMPEWRATGAGRALRVYPSGQLGLLAVDVPAGDTLVCAEYGRTALDVAAIVLSLASLLGLVSWLAYPAGGQRPRALRRVVVAGAASASLIVVLAVASWYAGGIQHPTGTWRRGDFVEQDFPVTLPPNAPASTCRIEVGVYGPDSPQRL